MSSYKMDIQNDNGNSEHKIVVDGILLKHPNVYTMVHTEIGEADVPLALAVENLHKNMDVRIESGAVPGGSNRYWIGHTALDNVAGNDLYNMDVTHIQKHKEKLPVINTLGTIAVMAVKKHFKVSGDLKDKETIEITADMITALPASVHNADTQKEFADKFLNHVHEVKVYIKHLTINVKIRFEEVKVLKEGVPAMFSLIEDGNGNYRDDDLFTRFKQQYKLEEMDGSYLLGKGIMHSDIGDGTTELVYTLDYIADPNRCEGEKFGIGQSIEKAASNMSTEEGFEITRQRFSKFLKGEGKPIFVRKAKDHLYKVVGEVADRLFDVIVKQAKTIAYDFEILCVYGGASILLDSLLYPRLVEHFEEYGIKILWVPAPYATEMNINGMKIYSAISKQEAKETATSK